MLLAMDTDEFREFLLVLRRALLMVVRFIESRPWFKERVEK
jgi:hypothetical protein